jgi:hypothetical protein
MVLRISDEKKRAWLDCEFCSVTYDYPFQAELRRSDVHSFPKLRDAIRAHYYLDEHGSFRFAPCPKRDDWRATDCQLVDEDRNEVLEERRLTFEPLVHAGKVRGHSLEVV